MRKFTKAATFVSSLLFLACAPHHGSGTDNSGLTPDPDICQPSETQIFLAVEASDRMNAFATEDTKIVKGLGKCWPHAKWYKTGSHWWQGYWGCEVKSGQKKWDLTHKSLDKTIPHYSKYSDFGMLTFPMDQGLSNSCKNQGKGNGWGWGWGKNFFCQLKKWKECKKWEWRWVKCKKVKKEYFSCLKERIVPGWCHSKAGKAYKCSKTVDYWDTCVKEVEYEGACHDLVQVEGQCEEPVDRSCQVSDDDLIEFGAQASAFSSHLDDVRPDGGSPSATALEAALDYFGQHDPAGKARHVVIITDGGDTCGDDAGDVVQKLYGLGVDVWVVAFQNSTDEAALNRMADLGGHPLAGGSKQYRILNTASDLAALFDEIINKPSGEVCDGIDNDCDGYVDEDLVRECASQCGGGVQFCKKGNWGGCTDPAGLDENSDIPDVPAEVCDGVDNDCDGETDEGFDVGGACVSASACGGMGTLTCSPDGKGVVCDAPDAKDPEAEKCDGVDNDCDGQIDEGLVESCDNQCGSGQKSCVMGSWTECQVSKPVPEVCDGVDNDCDGLVDEGFDVGSACVVGNGGCAAQGAYVCSDDGLEVVCKAQGDMEGGVEICNGKDDDCDGSVDEGEDICPPDMVCFKGTGGFASCVYD